MFFDLFFCNIYSFQGKYIEKKNQVKFCGVHFEINLNYDFGPQTDNNGIAALMNFDNEGTRTTESTVPTYYTWQ